MDGLLSDSEKNQYDDALASVFWTFSRPFQLFINAQVATISTSFTYSPFDDHSQNAAITANNTQVVPQLYTVTGCILYDNKQPWEYSDPSSVADKIRESQGVVRIKVEATGNALLRQCKMVNLDGFDFTLNSNARPHGLVGSPSRWTYTMQKVD